MKSSDGVLSPQLFFKKPFGENVEGLSHCGDKIYVIETAVQNTISRIRGFAAFFSGNKSVRCSSTP